MAASGGRVEARMSTSAVVVTGKRVNHVLHLLLSLFCCGWWIPVWLLLAAFGGERRQTVIVDDYGQIVSRLEPMGAVRVLLVIAAVVVLTIPIVVLGMYAWR